MNSTNIPAFANMLCNCATLLQIHVSFFNRKMSDKEPLDLVNESLSKTGCLQLHYAVQVVDSIFPSIVVFYLLKRITLT